EVMHFWGSLILLGLGWNFGFIGATNLLTKTYRPEEKSKVQALNDLLVFGTVALASLGAGRQFNLYGWYELNLITFPVIAIT
ncbi:MFS transporter, partial [Wenyingzhuangia sp. 1_MG-2023]|nr:MFS transporter [Wenyingzhuangia sp. 1_MG-2023]